MDKFVTELLNQKASGGSTTLEDFQAKFKSLAESRGWDVVQDSSKLDELEKLRIIHTGNPMPSGPGSLISAFYTPENKELIDIQSKLMASDPRDLSEAEANRLLARREELAVGAKYKTTIAAPEKAIEDLIFNSPRHAKLAEMINRDPATKQYKTNIMKSLITFHEGMEAYYFPKGFEKHDLWSGNIAIQNTYGTHVSPRVIKSEFAVAEKMGKDALELLLQYRKDELEGGITGFGTAKPERYERFLKGIIGNYEKKLTNLDQPIPKEQPFVPQVKKNRRQRLDNTLTRTKKKIEERKERKLKSQLRSSNEESFVPQVRESRRPEQDNVLSRTKKKIEERRAKGSLKPKKLTPIELSEFNKKLNLPLDYLSVSQIELYKKCPRQYYFRYIENIQPPSRMDMAFGKAMHSAAEFTHRNILEHGAPAATEAVQDIFSKTFDLELENANIFPGEDIAAERQRGFELAKQYNETIAPKVKPLQTGLAGKPWIERYIKHTIADVPMVGVIDLVDVADKKKGPVIADLKTLIGEKSQSELSESLQMAFYSKATGFRNTRYDVLSRDAENVHISRVENKPNKLDYQKLEEEVRDAASKISDRKFPVCKGKKSCNAYDCSYFSICKREKTPPKIVNSQVDREFVEKQLKNVGADLPYEQELERRETGYLKGLEKDFKAKFKGYKHNYLKDPIVPPPQVAEEKAVSLFKKIPKFHLVAAGAGVLWLASQFSGKDDAYNTIEGLPHGGMAEQQRKMLTDFGSGYRGIVTLPERLQKILPNISGYAAPVSEHISLIGKAIIQSKASIFEKARMSKDLVGLGIELSKSKYSHPIIINPFGIKRAQESLGGKYSYGELLKGAIRHERFHQKVVEKGFREELPKLESIVPQEFKETFKQQGLGRPEMLSEEYLAYSLSFPKSKRPPLFSFGTNLFSGKDDAYNTIEGLGHKGLGPKLRKLFTEFGSGYLRKSITLGKLETGSGAIVGLSDDLFKWLSGATKSEEIPLGFVYRNKTLEKILIGNKKSLKKINLWDEAQNLRAALKKNSNEGFFRSIFINPNVSVEDELFTEIANHEFVHAHVPTYIQGKLKHLSKKIFKRDKPTDLWFGRKETLLEESAAYLNGKYQFGPGYLGQLQKEFFDVVNEARKASNENLRRIIKKEPKLSNINRFSGFDDAYNIIEGMPHGGKGGELRKKNTDFSSPWKELLNSVSLKITNFMTKFNNASSIEPILSKYIGNRTGFNLALNPKKAAQYAKETGSIEAFAETLGIKDDLIFAKTKKEAMEIMKNLDISDRSREIILEGGSVYHSRLNKIFLIEESLKDFFKNERNIILKDKHMTDVLKSSLYHEYLEKSMMAQMGSNIAVMPGGHAGAQVVAGETAFLSELKNRKVASVFKSMRTSKEEKAAMDLGYKMFKGENRAINTIDGLPKDGEAAVINHMETFFGSKINRVKALKYLMNQSNKSLKPKRAAKSLYLSSKDLKIAQKQIWTYANGMAGKGHAKYAGSHVKQLSHFGGI